MRIDAHQHFWTYQPQEYEWIDGSMGVLRRDFLPPDLHPLLQGNGFHGSVAVQARQTLEETRWLLELAAQFPFIRGVVGWVDLRAADLRVTLAALSKNLKLVGVRHIVQSEPDDRFLLRPDFLRGIGMLEQFGLAYDILIHTKHLEVAVEFVSRFPRQRFVLDHLAKPPIKSGEIRSWKRDLHSLAQAPNVFCKVSGMVTEADWENWKPEHLAPYLDAAFDSFGPERLMVGSDWPVCKVAASYSRVMGVVEDHLSRHPQTVRDAVLGGNAQKFWKLRPPSPKTGLDAHGMG